MDANFILGAATVATMSVGIWGLVFRKNGNGNGHHPEPGISQVVERDPWPVDKLAEAIQPLAHLPEKLEQAFQQLAEAQAREPEVPPEWAARMLGDLEHIHEQLHGERPELAKVAVSLERLTDRLEAFIQLPPPPPPEIPRVDDLIWQIQALVNAERRRAAKSAFRPVIPETDPVEAPPQALVQTPPSQPPERVQRQPGPPTRAASPVYLEEFNLVSIAQDTVVEMIPPELNVFAVNVMNLGPGTVFLRENAEPIFDDPHATKLPPGTGDNGMRMPMRLYALADVGGADISVRLAL